MKYGERFLTQDVKLHRTRYGCSARLCEVVNVSIRQREEVILLPFAVEIRLYFQRSCSARRFHGRADEATPSFSIKEAVVGRHLTLDTGMRGGNQNFVSDMMFLCQLICECSVGQLHWQFERF